jgi:iron complex transport system substrate-binding protein
MRNGVAAILFTLLAICAGSAGAEDAAPARVVSIHLCADQFVLALADRKQIASVSWLATDDRRSHMATQAAGLRPNNGTAEEIVSLRPDLVLAGFRSARSTAAALRALGYRVVDLEFATDFTVIRRQIRELARLLGQSARGEEMIAEMDERLARAAADTPAIRPVAAIYQPMGFTSGRGSLEHALMTAAGFDNLAEKLGMGALGHLPLEALVSAKPAVLVNWMGNDPAPSLARSFYDHPALTGGPWRTLSLPNKFWACGAWYSALAVERLAGLRRDLPAGRRQ